MNLIFIFAWPILTADSAYGTGESHGGCLDVVEEIWPWPNKLIDSSAYSCKPYERSLVLTSGMMGRLTNGPSEAHESSEA